MPDEAETMTNRTPDEQLAHMIVHELLERSLIRAADADEIREKMATGQASSDDWTFWIENALERSGKEVTSDAI